MSQAPQRHEETAHNPDTADPPVLKFNEDRSFETELHCRVDAFFAASGSPRTAPVSVYVKAWLILIFSLAAYLLLVFAADRLWQGILLSILLGFGLIEIGVNIQHEGSHQGFSRYPAVNTLAAMTMELIGGSSYLWRWKHNRIHHSYTNIAHWDTDIDLGMLGRLSPSAERLWFHRWQQWYIWFFYCFLAIKWQLFDDFYTVIRGRIGNHRVPRPKGKDLAVFVAGKAVFLALAFGVPLCFHPIGQVLFYYAIVTIVAGLALSLIFILPHAVSEAEFPTPDTATGRMTYPRAVHQTRVTVDFRRHNPVVTTLLGGLNLHREHHLFPMISHAHYSRLAPVVDEVCDTFNVPHAEHKSYVRGLRSHFRWLKRMGRG